MHSCATRPPGPSRAPGSAARAAARRSSPRGSPLRSPRVRPSPPIIVMYIHEIGRIEALPYGAARPRRSRSSRRSPRAASMRGVPAGTARDARLHATGPTPGPPPPCGMQNVLCRFRCDTSAPNSPGRREPDQRVQVRAVDVHLPAVRVDDLADAARCPASNTPCVDGYVTMIAARSRACCAALRFEVGEIDVAVVVARDDDDLHAGHLRRRRIGAVRGRRDQADVAMRLAAARVIGARSSSSPAYSPCEPALGCSDTAA